VTGQRVGQYLHVQLQLHGFDFDPGGEELRPGRRRRRSCWD
jgi:hypothetical protein